MKLNKKQETEVLEVYNTWLHSYLNGDVKTYDFYLDDDYRFIGSTDNEEFLNRVDTTKFFAKTADQLAGKTDLKNTLRTIELIDGITFVTELFDAYFLIESDWKFYGRFRFTSALSKKKEGWRFIYQHFSMPDSKAKEGETLGAEQISLENQQLRDAIKRRTIELEQKNRELEIESSLERVRTRAMAMKNSSELSQLVDTVFQELTKLDFSLTACIINIIDGDDKSNTVWVTNPETGKDPESYYLKFEDYKFHHGMWKAWKARKNSWVYTIEGAEKETYQDYLFNETEFKRFSKNAKEGFLALERWVASFTFSNFGGLQTIGDQPLSENSLDILARFGKVFDLTYTRFNDLKQAETQAREAQIELALERVRAKTMAMQKSEDLFVVTEVFHQQAIQFSTNIHNSGFNINYKETDGFNLMMADSFSVGHSKYAHIPYIDNPIYNDLNEAKEMGLDFVAIKLSFDEKNIFWNHFFNYFQNWSQGQKKELLASKGFAISIVLLDNVTFYFANYNGTKFSEEENDLVKRFGATFQQAYTRFLDLQKAEAQAKEALIEAALERIRAQVTAMKASADLLDIVVTMRSEFIKLGHDAHYFWHMAWLHTYQKAMTSGDGTRIGNVMELPRDFHQNKAMMKWEKSDEPVAVFALETESAVDYIDKMVTLGDFQNIDHNAPTLDDIRHIGGLTFIMARTTHGEIGYSLPGVVKNPPAEDLDILVRFAATFDLAHKRFEDLRVSEHQARETQIELSLERVRSRSMAMHKSEELKEVIQVVYEQFVHLNILIEHTGFIIDYKARDDMHIWLADQHGVPSQVTIPYFDTAHWNSFNEAREKGKDFFANKLTFAEKNKFYQKLLKLIPGLPEEAKEFYLSCPGLAISTVLLDNVGLYIENFSGTPYSDKENSILMRFGKVFQQTYTRFLDLQKAESQAREAEIELALERVRARTMAMQHSNELPDAANVLFLEVQSLGIHAWSAGYNILAEDKKSSTCWMSSEGSIQESFILPFAKEASFLEWNKVIARGDSFFVQELGGKALESHYTYMRTLPKIDKIIKKLEGSGLSLPTYQINHLSFFNHGFLLFITYEKVPDVHDIFKRFTKVFEQTYTRFLDLQKSEAQTRQAQISLAVERVRAKALAMHKSEEIMEVVAKLKDEVMNLDIPDVVAATIFLKEGDVKVRMWDLSSLEKLDDTYQVQLDIIFKLKKTDPHLYVKRVWENQENYFVEMQDKKGFKRIMAWLREHDKNQVADEVEKFIETTHLKRLYHAAKKLNNGKLCVDLLNPPSDEMETILTKMGAAFDLAYKRFEDLQKAEVQTREAQIEASLERVRSRSMAMHKSDDLLSVIRIISQQLVELKFRFDNVSFGQNNQEHDYNFWVSINGHPDPVQIHVPYLDTPVLASLIEAYKNDVSFLMNTFTLEENKVWSQHMAKHVDFSFLSKAERTHIQNSSFTRSSAILPNIQLFVGKYEATPYTDEENKIIVRFAQVFDQTYTRFLDLQKAEEQAREAQIEASLERVRSKTMAMHNSKDVGETVVTLFNEVLKLGLDNSIRCGIGILEGNEGMQTWSANILPNGEIKLRVGMLDMTIHPLLMGLKKEWKKGETGYTYELIGNDVTRYYSALNKEPEYPFNADLDALPEKVFHNSFFFSEGILFAFASNPISEEAAKVLKRFTSVFEQTYTRFLDLQKAEEQTKEAQIEASLERVRSKAMAMHNSEDLVITANQLFKEFQYLNISFIRCGVLKIEESRKTEVYAYSLTTDKKAVAVYGEFNLSGHETLDEVFEHWQLQKEYTNEMKGDAVKRYYQLLNKQVDIPKIELGKSHFVYGFYFPEGCLYCFTNKKFSEDTIRILRKFNAVMGLTYRRYFELQESEARELAAIKESSLDRVRAEIASMQTANDLNRITPVVWKELNSLGVPFFRCGVFIVDNHLQKVHAYLSSPSGESIAALELEFDSLPLVKGVVSNWKQQKVYIEKWNKVQFIEFTQPLIDQGQIKNSKKYQGGLDAPENLVLQMVPFKQGMLYVGSEDSLGKDHISMVESLANAFSVAYTRYEDFKELEAAKGRAEDTLTELKSTQTQLIQSEKMASLGELTAGIAHEIQNPLNFVNNFSEISEEMMEELAEEIKDNSDEIVEEIMTDLKQNLNKIGLHGKRASNIVKGMLEHSRTSSGKKELTDINVLADEFLRLSYHGLRAKDKSFNAAFKTDFDESLPKVKVITQDLGRVILNLINNAFYACNERSKNTTHKNYKPIVTVSTSSYKSPSGDLGVEICVKDNGSGVPDDIKDKIFQPFFTTKPTGSGTGLGLSMSYDIITKGHDGELTVDSKKGEFTNFTIVLPIRN